MDDIDGTGNVRKAFMCPYHAWTYDLNGRLIGTPNVKEDELFDRSAFPLHPIHVDSYAGFLFVNLGTEPSRPLMEALTDGAESITVFERFKMDELRIGARIVYEVEANWKIVVENYNECLHCPQIHPELVQVVPLFRFGEVWDEEIRDDGNRMVEGATSFTISGKSELPKLPDLQPEDYEMYYGSYEFPNLMLNLHPDCGMYYIAYPKGPNHTTVVSEFLFRPETIEGPDFKPEPVVELWDLISHAGLGGLPTRADRRRFARVHHRHLPAPGPVPLLVQRGIPAGHGPRARGLADLMADFTFIGVPIDSVGRAGGTEHGPAKLRALGLAGRRAPRTPAIWTCGSAARIAIRGPASWRAPTCWRRPRRSARRRRRR